MLLNKERAEGIMEKYGLDVLIAATAENVRYAADYMSELPFVKKWAFQAYALLPRDGCEPVLIVPYSALPLLAEHPSWIADIRVYGAATRASEPGAILSPGEERLVNLAASVKKGPDALAILVDALKEKGLARGKIGLDEGEILASDQARIRDALRDATIVDAFGIFREIRMVKTEEEIEAITKAIRVNERAMMDVIRMVDVGVSEKEIVECYDQSVVKYGGIPRLHQLGAGTRGAAFFAPSDYRAKKGDLIYLDPVCTVDHYWSDMSRSVVIGEPSKKQASYYAAIRTGLETGTETIRPGVKISEIFDIIMEAVRDNGIPHYERFHTGHGIGLEMYEAPIVNPAGIAIDPFLPHIKEVTLEENMLFNVEDPYYEFGFGTLQLEDTIRVTKTGYERLQTLGHDMFVC